MKFLPALKHLFVPRRTNNHKAKLLHPSGLSVLIFLFLLYQLIISLFLKTYPAVLGYASSISPEQVIALTNQKRAELGLSPLTINSKLNDAAQRKAGDMFALNYWAHNSPTGKEPWSFFREVGYSYTFAGENLARDFMESSEVVEAWMNSPSHRDNIANSNYREIGLAVVNGTLNGVETTLVVQLFGTPTPAAAKITPTASTTAGAAAESPRIAVQPQQSAAPAVLYQQPTLDAAPATTPAFSPFWLTRSLTVIVLGLVLTVLLLDVYFVHHRRIVRLSSRNIGHLMFIAVLSLLVALAAPGAII